MLLFFPSVYKTRDRFAGLLDQVVLARLESFSQGVRSQGVISNLGPDDPLELPVCQHSVHEIPFIRKSLAGNP
jgi:hypothetical protein